MDKMKKDIMDDATIMTPEEEEVWLGKYFGKKSESKGSMDDHMLALEKEFEESMQLASAASTSSSAAATNADKQSGENDAMRKVYAELHSQADPEIIQKLRMAMEDIPEHAHGLADCKKYFKAKQHYTLQDILVAQYVLNDGLLMRQNHGTENEYHVDIAEPLV